LQLPIKYVQYKSMNITNDPTKNNINLQKHQIDLADIEGVFMMTALLLLKTATMTKNVL